MKKKGQKNKRLTNKKRIYDIIIIKKKHTFERVKNEIGKNRILYIE